MGWRHAAPYFKNNFVTMTKEKLAKLRGMGLVFDEVFDEITELKERKRLANELAIVFDEALDTVQNENQLLYHTYYSKNGVTLIDKYLKDNIIKQRVVLKITKLI